MKPRHADLLASLIVYDFDSDTLIAYLNHFMMFYIRTGDRLLGVNTKLDAELSELRACARCEWKGTIKDLTPLARFAHFINAPLHDPNVQMIAECS